MRYQRQPDLAAKLDARIPRGPRGGTQNRFRFAVSFFAGQPHYTFEESLELALRSVRESELGFTPKMLT